MSEAHDVQEDIAQTDSDCQEQFSSESEPSMRRPVFQAISGLLSRTFAEACIIKVDPTTCISIEKFRSRAICKWGVKKIKTTILGRSSSDSFVNGFVSTGNFSVIPEIPEEHNNLVIEHFKDRGETDEEAQSLAVSGKWFLTVEGGHVHAALLECIEEFSEKFAGFRWPVVKISWQPAERLRAIGRMCNEMQKDEHIIDFPLPDAMQSLREIIDAHSKNTGVAIVPRKRTKPGFIKEVVEIYAGGQGYSCNTLRTICGTVLKMSSSFVSSMRSLLTEECSDLWKSLGGKRPFGNDTRVFKKLISTQSLKRTPKFLDHNALNDDDRLNVIHRLIFLAKERECFKAFSSAEIESQSQCVLAAQREMKKFEAFLGEEEWPSDLENLKRNVLRTTLLDSLIREHTRTQGELLPTMVNVYLKASGAHGSQKLAQYKRMQELDQGQNDEINGTSACRRSSRRASECQESDIGGNFQSIENNNVESIEGDAAHGSDMVPPDEDLGVVEQPEKDCDTILSEAGIELRIETLLEYERASLGIDGSFNFVVADPFQKVGTDPFKERTASQQIQISSVLEELVDDKGINLYLQSMRRMLRRGGYVFVFLDWHHLNQWKICSNESQFEVVCDPFLVIKDSDRVQRMTLKGLQTMYEPAIVLRKPGEHPDGFEMDKISPYTHLPYCKMPRWCNVIDGVPPAAQKVTFKPSRAQVRPNEKPCALYIELLKTFCSPMGKGLDPFSATLTMGLACIATDRRCVLLETDEKCISHAKPRAVDFAKSKLLEQSAETNQRANDSDTENESTAIRTSVTGNGLSGNEEEIESRIDEQNEDTNDSGSVTRTLGLECASNTTKEVPKTPKDSGSRQISPAKSERELSGSRSGEPQKSSLSSPYSPSLANASKQLSFVVSESNIHEEQTESDQNSTFRCSSVFGEVSSPIVKKRTRRNCSLLANRNRIVENSPPSMYRRSKRSRKVVNHYEL